MVTGSACMAMALNAFRPVFVRGSQADALR